MILKNLIYILQSENYYFNRFLKFSYTHPAWWKLENRQKLVWTKKVFALWVGSGLLFWLVAFFCFSLFGLSGLVVLPVLLIVCPFIIGASLALLWPIDFFLKRKKLKMAMDIIENSKVRTIGIAGSYGKTSTKEILAMILTQKFQVIKTPENVNTDVGIAEFVIQNKNQFSDEKIFIAEMGAYKKREIEKICKIVHPQFSILTGINESHLERFGSLENIIQGKFELAQNTTSLAILNLDDENIKNNYLEFEINNSEGVTKREVKNIIIKKDFQGLEFEWDDIAFETKLLAEHNISLILLCVRMAQAFSMTREEIIDGVKKIQIIEHRLQPIYNAVTDVMVIDDSYNGNFDGIQSGIQLLQRAQGRKVVLTPGLVELGSKMEEIHIKIGNLYAKNVDVVLLIESKMTKYILKGLAEKKFTQYKVYKTTAQAHDDLANVLKRGDTIIFQNDLTDNYF